ncbi:efflux RND transporter permease subunit [Derxia lacustris]|uniref:efflux RND transporter permease subunit n=1 Tax=Derxia lacustris TaxID=764842 RepID=UPI000A17247D|nr:efflux RND transporter permease subunit [Derxia lacustris]
MWIVRVALGRPYTFLVLAILIVLGGLFTLARTATDIFPAIRIPIVAVIWQYSGLPPDEIANRVVATTERAAQTTITGIEHTESQSLGGVSVVKYFFQPNVSTELAVAQITAVSQALLRNAPPGTTPPFVLAYDASTVPILQLAFASNELSETEIYDTANTQVRTGLAPVPGAAVPFPFGGKQRQIQVDLDPAALRAHGLSAQDVTVALGNQNLVIPAGTQKIGDQELNVRLNASPTTVAGLNELPLRYGADGLVQLRDVANVRDGAAPQTNIVRVEGKRAVLMSMLKTGNASTLAIIDKVHELLPDIQAGLPRDLTIKLLGDQSVFVRAAVDGVIREGIVAAALTGLMILLFLGSWRSTLIITVSIPLSVLASIICLSALGETINIMTLGGLALAVGILVDDATVAIENINWHLEQGKEVEDAILDGAHQIATPALVSTLCICIVFIPMFFLTGIARFLFVPLAEAVVFAMLASYLLSRTLIPTLAKYWLRMHDPLAHENPRGVFQRFQHGFELRFARLRDGYHRLLEAALRGPWRFAAGFALVITLGLALLPLLGRDFFPAVDAGQIKLHIRAPSGTRIETTAQLCDRIEAVIREVVPEAERAGIVDNLGLPYSGINLTYASSAPIGPGDADILVALNEGHRPTADYIRTLRDRLPGEFPGVSFAFLPADIVSQILNFGLPAPFDVQITGFNVAGNLAWAGKLLERIRQVPGAVDVRIHQAFDYPQINVDVDRANAMKLGLQQRDIASNLLVSLSGSFQTNPGFWLDPRTGIQYSVATQTPQPRMQSLDDLATLPVTAASGNAPPQVLANVASFKRSAGPAVVSHYNAMPTLDIYGAVQDSDLGAVADRLAALVAEAKKDLPKGSSVNVRGQIQTMNSSFNGLLLGLAGAVVLVYLLIVVNFQSWLDPLVIISALPAALGGIVVMLFITHTTVSVPALTGAIMCMGVATANSILVVSFARERLNHGESAFTAALEAGFTRFRPVLMTALAMVIGMLPMALGFGEGGEQNAPLGRAVVGGLLAATVATLFFVPVVFSLVHGRADRGRAAPGFAATVGS